MNLVLSTWRSNFIDNLVLLFPLEENESCAHCTSIELDHTLKRHFKVNVCSSCRESLPNQYSLITKTTAKENYLLTEEELNDSSVLPYMTKPNPYKSTWSDMQLYLAEHVEKFAISKWRSLDGLDSELAKRVKAKESRKERQFQDKLNSKFS